MQMPIPPVSQCRKTQTANACQVKKAGTKARNAARCNPVTQSTGPQDMPADSGRVVVVVVMRNL